MSSEIEPKTFGENIESFLRARHPTKTADYVAAETGCSRAQVCKWLEGAAKPNMVAFIRLSIAYGPGFIAAVLGDDAPAWLDDAHRAEQIQKLEESRARIDEELRAIAR